jgi:hypothetical protein
MPEARPSLWGRILGWFWTAPQLTINPYTSPQPVASFNATGTVSPAGTQVQGSVQNNATLCTVPPPPITIVYPTQTSYQITFTIPAAIQPSMLGACTVTVQTVGTTPIISTSTSVTLQ